MSNKIWSSNFIKQYIANNYYYYYTEIRNRNKEIFQLIINLLTFYILSLFKISQIQWIVLFKINQFAKSSTISKYFPYFIFFYTHKAEIERFSILIFDLFNLMQVKYIRGIINWINTVSLYNIKTEEQDESKWQHEMVKTILSHSLQLFQLPTAKAIPAIFRAIAWTNKTIFSHGGSLT